MNRTVKLSDTQARAIREAKVYTVNGGPTTMRVRHFRGAVPATWVKLYRLGLTTAPNEYSYLTSAGVAAHYELKADAALRTVIAGDGRGGKAYTAASPEAAAALMDRIKALSAEIEVPSPERYTVVRVRHGLAVIDRTDGTVVRDGYNSRYPAREDAATLNESADPVNWSDIADEPAQWAVAGRLGRVDVSFEDGLRFVADVYTLWPIGTRVRAEVDGVIREGRVNGADVRYVARVDHPNYGRVFVGVDLDASPKAPAMRTRIFTDQLHRI